MSNTRYIEEIEINSYDELVQIIQGKTQHCNDLRGKFIFRGIEDEDYKLIPSALRNDNKLNDYVDEDIRVMLEITINHAIEHGLRDDDGIDHESAFDFITLDKYGEKHDGGGTLYARSMEEYQYLKEAIALMNFFENADKVGLKIPTNQDIRVLFSHKENDQSFNLHWPNEDYFELISLAKHYGVPTRALDWSYDYKVALYFAVKNILNENYQCNSKPDNAILWAFNYNLLDIDYLGLDKNPFAIKYYRPEYNSNPNLNAQKGLFTFIINDLDYITEKPFDEFIEELSLGTHNIEGFAGEKFIHLSKGEKAFYKFIIPEDKKPEILNDLYMEGYSEEYLFPGYAGVTQSIENRIRLDKLLLKTMNCDKKNVLLVMDDYDIEKIKKGEKLYVFKKYNFPDEVDTIFIYSHESKEVIGCFRGDEIITNTPLYFWKNFSEKSGLDKQELFDYFEPRRWGWAIKINDLRIFDNPIKLYDFKEPGNYCYIEHRDELKFLLNFK